MKYYIVLFIVLLSIVAAVGLYKTRPQTKKSPPERPVPLVKTVEINPGSQEVFVEAYGTVVPAKRITLQSEVEGRIIDQNPELTPGGLLNEGDVVILIDPSDYELSVQEHRTELEEALVELDLEQGRQVIARREWNLLEQEPGSSDAGKSLALREPQLKRVQAKISKAMSRLAAAELALRRTTIRAAFNAIVLEKFTDKGQLVSKQTPIATLVGTDQFWVRVSVPVAAIHRVSFDRNHGSSGSTAQIIFEPASGSTLVRTGIIHRVMGDLDPEGRMARLLVVIDDPLNLSQIAQTIREPKKKGEYSRVLLGSYVKVLISAGTVNNVYPVPRQALREGDVIWVTDRDNALKILPVNIVWRRKDDVLVTADLSDGDRLITSRLQSPLPGMKLQNAQE